MFLIDFVELVQLVSVVCVRACVRVRTRVGACMGCVCVKLAGRLMDQLMFVW